jgi:hypothetical protein
VTKGRRADHGSKSLTCNIYGHREGALSRVTIPPWKTPTERITARDAKYSNANGNENLTCVVAAFGAASSGSSETSMACPSA